MDSSWVVLESAALQVEAGPGGDPERFRRHAAALVAEAAGRGARLVALPALTGLIWGPGFMEAAAALASRHRVYLAAGTTSEPCGAGKAHVAPFFGPDGGLLGRQAQIHLLPEDVRRGWVPGSEPALLRAGPATVGILIQADAWFPEVARTFSLLGADLLLVLAAVPAPYSPWLQAAGGWQEAQQNQVFLAEADLVGELPPAAAGAPGPGWAACAPGAPMTAGGAGAAMAAGEVPCAMAAGVRLEGRSAVIGPCEITPGEAGFLAQAGDPRRPQAVAASLDFAALEWIWGGYPVFGHLNHGLYRDRLAGVYAAVGGERRGLPA